MADEPEEILGSNEAPNPQELLMAALNARMTVGYVAGAAKRGISLTRLEIETRARSTCAASSLWATRCRPDIRRSTMWCGSRATAPPSSSPKSTPRSR